MNRRRIILSGVIFVAIAVSILVIYVFLKGMSELPKTIGPYIPKEGEEKELRVFVQFRNVTDAEVVTIRLFETDTGLVSTASIEKEGVVSFTVLVGKEYVIEATINNSTKSIACKIEPKTEIQTVVSYDQEIELIYPYEGTDL